MQLSILTSILQCRVRYAAQSRVLGQVQQQQQPQINSVLCNNQRWSRGHKARGQGQGHKKNPRSRTAFPRTDTLEAEDRNARGQGQGPRTQSASALQKKKKKKGLHKNFSGDLH